MDPKRLEKLDKIQEWELAKPSKDEEWAEDVKKENLDVKFDYQLQEMLDSHAEKVLKVEKDLDEFTNWPQVRLHGITKQFEQMFKDQGNPTEIEGKTLQQWIDEEFESQQLYYTWKVGKLNQSVERIAKEIELRASGHLEVKEEKLKGTLPEGSTLRVPLGTTYYIDPTNGTDTFAGTRIDSTVDSTADTTHFVDNALTGADDYILNSYFYNVTRGIGSLISDFVAATDTVTLAGAITGMTAGDTYYILNAWIDLDQFTENARSAGDKVIIRRGAVQMDDGTDLNFTSDGTVANPIVIEADYDNLWRDQVDLSATATATLTFGSKTVTFSADISGSLAAGDWIYASGDNNREFAYEVASVVTTTVTLHLPYKGNQAGSGKTMYNMQDNPIWNDTAAAFSIVLAGDYFWYFCGLDIRSTDADGAIDPNTMMAIFKDCIFKGAGANDMVVETNPAAAEFFFFKCRADNFSSGFVTIGSFSYDYIGFIWMQDIVLTSTPIGSATPAYLYLIDVESDNTFAPSTNSDLYKKVFGRNVTFSSITIPVRATSQGFYVVNFEDYGGTVGDNRYFNSLGTASAAIYQSETTTVRSGGSNKSIKVTPSTALGSVWEYTKLLVFELPIYATTDSKTYTVYFRPSATGDWSADPTASELWIELEAWGHATNNFRKITKSTGTIDMNGSTAWQSLTVTVAPAQAGVAYLRCWYAKTKEAGTNIFYVDPVPVIT